MRSHGTCQCVISVTRNLDRRKTYARIGLDQMAKSCIFLQDAKILQSARGAASVQTIPGLDQAPTSHVGLIDWVRGIAELTRPRTDRVV